MNSGRLHPLCRRRRPRLVSAHWCAAVLGVAVLGNLPIATGRAASGDASGPAAVRIEPSVWAEGAVPGRLEFGASPAPATLQVEADRISRDGTPVSVWRHEVAGDALTLPSTPFASAGFYRLRFSKPGTASTIATLSVGVIAQPLGRGASAPQFGVNTHFSQRNIPDRAYTLLRLANVDLIRDQWTWDSVEARRGRLVAPTHPNGGIAHARAMMLQSGIRILNDCAYANPLYDDNRFPRSHEGVAAFARYCAFVAREFGPALYGSEIWNESNDIDAVTTYAPLARATAAALREAMPQAAILQGGGAGAGGGADPFYEESVFKTIGAGCCTGDSVHPYMTNPDVGYFAAQSRLINPVTQQSIVNVAFVSFWTDYISHWFHLDRGSNFTEIGWSTAHDGREGVSDEKQAAYVSRLLIDASEPSACTRSSGISSRIIDAACTPTPSAVVPDLRSLFVYDFQDDGADADNREHNFGLVHADLTPKMSYSAFAQAAGILRGTEFADALHFAPHSLARALLFRDASRSWLVLWTIEFAPDGIVKTAADLQIPRDRRTRTTVEIDGAVDECRDWDGHPCEIPADRRWTIANLPLYLRLPPGRSRIDVRELAGM
jgi:hypothetical protein